VKKIFLFLSLFLVGCATTQTANIKNLSNLSQISVGMSQEEVSRIMGDSVIVGYEITSEKSGAFKPITVRNPQRSETIQRGGKVYQAVFYFTSIRQEDGSITDDELTPLIFRDGRLVGQGWPFLNKILRKN